MRIAYGSLLPLLFYATTQYAMYAVFNGSENYCTVNFTSVENCVLRTEVFYHYFSMQPRNTHCTQFFNGSEIYCTRTRGACCGYPRIPYVWVSAGRGIIVDYCVDITRSSLICLHRTVFRFSLAPAADHEALQCTVSVDDWLLHFK